MVTPSIVRTSRQVVTSLGWCDFTVYSNGEIEVVSPFWTHVFFKPTHKINGQPMTRPAIYWMNKTHLLSSPNKYLEAALDQA
tara:strand:+ start:155 stop:400 length:246 start_codon:yes stop_codon:yes gene_type:complete